MFVNPNISYSIGDKSFSTIKEVKTFIEDSLGKHIDAMCPNLLNSKCRLNILNYLIDNRDDICDILQATIKVVSEDSMKDYISIFEASNK